jgi:hypothetical protein
MDVLLGNRRPHLEEYDVKMEAVSIHVAMCSLILYHPLCLTNPSVEITYIETIQTKHIMSKYNLDFPVTKETVTSVFTGDVMYLLSESPSMLFSLYCTRKGTVQ